MAAVRVIEIIVHASFDQTKVGEFYRSHPSGLLDLFDRAVTKSDLSYWMHDSVGCRR